MTRFAPASFDPRSLPVARELLHRTRMLDGPAVPLPSDPREVKQLLTSEEFRAAVERVAHDSGLDPTDALTEAASYLREMSAEHNQFVTGLWQRFSAWMMRGYDTLIDEDALARLRKLDRWHSLIFLISHRSYLDEFVLPPSLYSAGFSPTYGLAGANLNFFPLGTIARRTGIVHVRRATADAPVYRIVLRSFVGQLVQNRANLIWSIEGGRSRTGKLRPPRYGLLRYVADAVESIDATEALVVPVSIVYDQLPVHEIGKMASESRGLGKQPENMRWLVGYARGLQTRLGRVYLDFGEPLQLRDRLAELSADDSSARYRVERVAIDVCHRINQATPVTPTAAVCVALLGVNRALTLDEVLATVEPLATYLTRRGWPVAGGANLTNRSTVRRALQELVRSGVLSSYSGGKETVWGIGQDQHLVAAVYRNSAVHVLLVRAITELALFATTQQADADHRVAWELALRLRELLKFDFFFAQRDEFAEELWAEFTILANAERPSKSDVTAVAARKWLEQARPVVAHLVLRPFIDAYRVVAEQLAETDPREQFDDERFIDECLRLAKQWALQGHLASDESVSGEMFRTALKLARHHDLVESTSPDVAKRRAEFAAELREVQAAIAGVAALVS